MLITLMRSWCKDAGAGNVGEKWIERYTKASSNDASGGNWY